MALSIIEFEGWVIVWGFLNSSLIYWKFHLRQQGQSWAQLGFSMAHRLLRDLEADGWERSDFPIICESCLGDNPYVRMVRSFLVLLYYLILVPLTPWVTSILLLNYVQNFTINHLNVWISTWIVRSLLLDNTIAMNGYWNFVFLQLMSYYLIKT